MKSVGSGSSRPRLQTMLRQALIPAAAAVFFQYKGKPVMAGVLYGIGGLTLLSGVFLPPVFNRIEKFGQAVGRVVTTAVTWALLVPVFYLVFVPGRLILMMRGIDPMCRKFPTDAPTYWVSRKPVTDGGEYKRQF